MDNPFLSRGEREEDQPPSVISSNDNPFATAEGRAAITTVATVAANNPEAVVAGARFAQHAVKTGCTIPFGKVWIPGCGAQSAKVSIRWHILLLAYPVLIVLNVLRGSKTCVSCNWLENLFVQLASVPLLFCAIIVHEIGHLAMARLHGGVPSHILLWPLGGLAVHYGPTMSLCARIKIALAGPLTHVPMFFFWVALFKLTGCTYEVNVISYPADSAPGTGVMGLIFATQAELNITLFVFNLFVPCIPLDASTIVVCTLVGCGLPHLKTAKIVVGLSCASIILLGVAVFLAFLSGRVDPSMSVLTLAWLIFKTWRLHLAVSQGRAAVEKHDLFKTLPASAGAADAAPVAPVASGPRGRGRGGKKKRAQEEARSGSSAEAYSVFGGGGGSRACGGGGGDGGGSDSMFSVTVGGGGGTAPLQAAGGGGAVWPPPGTFAPD